ncbi:exopolysaccharide biosynthesis polyprenyl glycosylphosphotransferase [Solimonas variicoloris]|uniref:exopolysaccharide biosynthesis polyprenyl glycosylphosphotransferase n=1 Tax=Solimonas variicoloris TaxID=254408 RepID=UPI00037FBE01|nr:exopolysaccharide biosynthesis polyprenyl glycosylphosphotransferase [Solimonas variicoloris]
MTGSKPSFNVSPPLDCRVDLHSVSAAGRAWRSVLATLLPLLEIAALAASAWIAALLVRELDPGGFDASISGRYGLLASSMSLFAPFVLHVRRAGSMRGTARALRELAGPYALFCAIAALALIVNGDAGGAAAQWLGFWLLSGFALLLALRSLVLRAPAREVVAVVGAGPATDRLVRHLQRRDGRDVELIGVFDDRATRTGQGAVARRGTVDSLIELGRRQPIDLVLIALPDHAEERIIDLLKRLKSLAVSIAMCPCGIELELPRMPVEYLGDHIPVTLLAERPIRRGGAVAKMLEDYLLGGLITLALLPLMALIALAIRLDSPGPVLFRQRRHAWNNGEFDVFKFRSMRWSPRSASLGLRQTERDDPRITRVGRFLRRSSLDELPQLFNVLRGEMSLVGPRPHAVNMKTEERLCEEIIETYAHRHRVKPGLTGLAQVRGYRGATHTAEQLRLRIESDLEYVEHWSIWLDLKILVMTAWTVIRGENAY